MAAPCHRPRAIFPAINPPQEICRAIALTPISTLQHPRPFPNSIFRIRAEHSPHPYA